MRRPQNQTVLINGKLSFELSGYGICDSLPCFEGTLAIPQLGAGPSGPVFRTRISESQKIATRSSLALHLRRAPSPAFPARYVSHTFSPRARPSDAVSDNVCQANMATTLGVVPQEVGRSSLSLPSRPRRGHIRPSLPSPPRSRVSLR
jgi:hypothetical protein